MKRNLLSLILLIIAVAMHAQQVITTAGNYTSNTSGSLSWTLGEGIIDTYAGSKVILTQGFQQSNLIVTAIKEVSKNSPEISAYPNPTNDFVSLKVATESVKNSKFLLYDVYGKLLQEQKLVSSETKISFNNLAPGTYLLKLVWENKELKSFKIIKK
jgi:hypothetical protein